MDNFSTMMTGSRLSDLTTDISTTATDAFEKQQIAKAILLPVIIIIGLVGNLLVCIAIVKTPKLRKVVNYFVFSLAVSDLLVCSFVMPFAIYQEVAGEWRMERWVCHMWILSDVLLCTASIWNLCLVSIDRYFAITQPIKYAKFRTPRNAIATILSNWFLSFLIAIILVLVMASETTATGDVLCQVNSKPTVGVISALAAFFIPSLISALLYIRIFIVIRRKVTPQYSDPRKAAAYQAAKVAQRQSSISINRVNSIDILDNTSTSEPSGDCLSASKAPKTPAKPTTLKRRWTVRRVDSVTIKRETKTAIVLAIVVGAFFGCWLPYFIIYLVMLWDDTNLHMAFQVATWIGWCNSLINPLIYTIFNEDFREAFKDIILCRKL